MTALLRDVVHIHDAAGRRFMANTATLRARLVNIGSTGVVAGVHLLCFAAPFVGISWRIAGLALASFLLQLWGITAGYHRYFSHHSFKTGRGFQFVLGWLGCAAMQNGPLWWASNHRRHHRYSDRPGDPHSPVLGGLWHSYLGWIFSGNSDHPDLANVRDFTKFKELCLLDRYKWVPTIVTGVVCAIVGGVSGVVWGLGIATTLAFHAPLMVNSGAHRWGAQRFQTKDSSRNNVWLGTFVLGDGWHNNHHHDPSSVRHGFVWWELDVTYYVIWLLSKIGIVWGLRAPRPWLDATLTGFRAAREGGSAGTPRARASPSGPGSSRPRRA